jgi:hypothetical protein
MSEMTARDLSAEIGLDMPRFGSAPRLAAWKVAGTRVSHFIRPSRGRRTGKPLRLQRHPS